MREAAYTSDAYILENNAASVDEVPPFLPAEAKQDLFVPCRKCRGRRVKPYNDREFRHRASRKRDETSVLLNARQLAPKHGEQRGEGWVGARKPSTTKTTKKYIEKKDSTRKWKARILHNEVTLRRLVVERRQECVCEVYILRASSCSCVCPRTRMERGRTRRLLLRPVCVECRKNKATKTHGEVRNARGTTSSANERENERKGSCSLNARCASRHCWLRDCFIRGYDET